MFNEHIAPVIEAEAEAQAPRSHLRRRHGVEGLLPRLHQLQIDYPEVYIKNAATPPEADEDRSKVKEIKVDIVIQGATMGEAEKR